MTGCKRCALKGRKGERKKKNKRKKEEKMGIKIFFFFLSFLYKSVRMFYHMRSGYFSNVKRKLYLDLEDHIRYYLRSKI